MSSDIQCSQISITRKGSLRIFDMGVRNAIETASNLDKSDAGGRLCLVELKTGEKLVRHLARGYQLGEWKLTDLKGRSEVLEVVSAAPILWIRP